MKKLTKYIVHDHFLFLITRPTVQRQTDQQQTKDTHTQ